MQQARMQKKKQLAALITTTLGLAISGNAFAVSGFQMIGFGEDQVALGGAVTAQPTSAMTALTNPAGLGYVGHRADFSLEAFMPKVKATLPTGPGTSTTVESIKDMYGIPSIGWVAPTHNPDLTVGGGMYATAGLGADYPGVGYSSVTMFKVAPAFSYKLNPSWSVGAALNINMLQLSFGPYSGPLTSNSPTNFYGTSGAGQAFGFGGSFGAMYEAIPDLVRVGASYTTKANFQKTKFNGDTTSFAGPGTYNAAFDFPQQAALGVAVMPTAPLTVSADVKWLNYEATMKDFNIDGPNGASLNLRPNWRDVWVYAIGATYKMEALQLMAGYNYSDSPVRGDSVQPNVLFPAIIKHHFTAGVKYALGNNWDVGGSVMYSPKEEVTGDFVNPSNGAPAGQGTVENQITSVGMNFGYRF